MKIVVLASGSGTLAQAIFDAGFDVVALICDKEGAEVLERAKKSDIPTFLHPMKSDRIAWNTELLKLLESLTPDLVVSAGFMRILAPEITQKFKIINSHPALLPLFPGAHAVRDALAAGAVETGTTIHWVDAGVDTGEIIAQERVPIQSGDTEELLHERIKIVERGLIVATIRTLQESL